MLQIKFVQKSLKKTTFTTIFRQSCVVLCRTLQLAICRKNRKNLLIFDLRTGKLDMRLRNEYQEFADLWT
jgi:hypothetical protein